jgi:hypothetical protein
MRVNIAASAPFLIRSSLVSPSGQETVPYRFQNGSDGVFPEGGLVLHGKGGLDGIKSQDVEIFFVFFAWHSSPSLRDSTSLLYCFSRRRDSCAPKGACGKRNWCAADPPPLLRSGSVCFPQVQSLRCRTIPVSACEGCMHHKGQESSSRKLVWVEGQSFGGWGCSECAWVFNLPDLPTGKSIEEMKRDFEMQLSDEFASHACANSPRVKGAKSA